MEQLTPFDPSSKIASKKIISFIRFKMLNPKIYFFVGELSTIIDYKQQDLNIIKKIGEYFLQNKIKLTFIGENVMQSIRDNKNLKSKQLQQDSPNSSKLKLLLKIKKYFRENVQFLTSDEAYDISKTNKPKKWQLRAKYTGTLQLFKSLIADVIIYTKTLEKKLQTLEMKTENLDQNQSNDCKPIEQQVNYYLEEDMFFSNPIKKENITKAFQYGKEFIPMSQAHIQKASLYTFKEFKLLGTVMRINVPRQSLMGGCDAIFPKVDSKVSKLIITSLVQACENEDKYIIARFILRNNCIPKLVVLIPKSKQNCDFFYMIELPTSESTRDFQFQSLMKSNTLQQQTMRDFINSNSIESDESENNFKIGKQSNQTIIKLNNLIYQRGLVNICNNKANDYEMINKFDDIQSRNENNQDILNKIKQIFRLKLNQQFNSNHQQNKVYWSQLLDQKNKQQNDESNQSMEQIQVVFNSNFDKKRKNLEELSLSDMSQSDIVTELNQPLLNQIEFNKYVEIVKKLIDDLFNSSIKNQSENLICQVLLCIRQKSIEFEQPQIFNEFIQLMFQKYPRSSCWKFINMKGISLIYNSESNNSEISVQQSQIFLNQIDNYQEQNEDQINSEMTSTVEQILKANSQKDEEIQNDNEQQKQTQTKEQNEIEQRSQSQLKQNQKLNNKTEQQSESIFHTDESEVEDNIKQINKIQNINNQTKEESLIQTNQKKQNKINSFCKLSSFNSICSDTSLAEINEEEKHNIQDKDDKQDNSSSDESQSEIEIEQDKEKKISLKHSLSFSFKLCVSQRLFKQILFSIDLKYRPPRVKNIPNNLTPKQIFDKLWSDQIWELITKQTNLYAEQYFKKKNQDNKNSEQNKNKQQCFYSAYESFTVSDIKRYVICEILMGIKRLPSFSDYFSSDPLLSGGLNKIISRNKYQQITSFLHLANNEDSIVQMEDLGKIKEFQQILNNNFSQYYVPSNYLAIDEGIIPFKGTQISSNIIKKQ